MTDLAQLLLLSSESKQRLSAEAIQSWLMTRIAAMLELDAASIDPRQPFTYYGLGSIQAVSLTGDLEVFLNRKLSPTLAWDYPTIELLANHLVNESQPSKPVQTSPCAHAALFKKHERADRDHRAKLSFSRRAEPAGILGVAAQRRGCH